MNVKNMLKKYFSGEALKIVEIHCAKVAELSLKIADNLNLDDASRSFIYEAAMLHDIGICKVYAPDIYMFGDNRYIMHGVLGREILEAEGYPKHALVCERHTGVGLTVDDIIKQNLPLPKRDMIPQSLEEEIICFADLFYSKTPGRLEVMKSASNVREKLLKFGNSKVQIFDRWFKLYGASIIST